MRGPVSSSCGSATRLFSAVFQPVRAAHHRRPAHNSSATVSSAEDENHDDNDCNHGDHHRDQSLRNRTTCNFEQIEEKFLWLDKITETREILTFERAKDKKTKIPPSFTAETGRSPVTQPLKGVLDSGGGSAQDLHYARNMSKAFFIYDVIQREIRRGRRIKTLCEMGFCAPPHHQHQLSNFMGCSKLTD